MKPWILLTPSPYVSLRQNVKTILLIPQVLRINTWKYSLTSTLEAGVSRCTACTRHLTDSGLEGRLTAVPWGIMVWAVTLPPVPKPWVFPWPLKRDVKEVAPRCSHSLNCELQSFATKLFWEMLINFLSLWLFVRGRFIRDLASLK